MKQALTVRTRRQITAIGKVAYVLCIVMFLYQSIIGDYDSATTNLLLAFVLDPFASVKWHDRTKTQKALLLLHPTLLIIGAAFSLSGLNSFIKF